MSPPTHARTRARPWSRARRATGDAKFGTAEERRAFRGESREMIQSSLDTCRAGQVRCARDCVETEHRA